MGTLDGASSETGNCPMMCDGECVDTTEDPNNCGSCGNACAADQECADGECVLACPGGAEPCGDMCVSTDSDPANCGRPQPPRQNSLPSCEPMTIFPSAMAGEADSGPPASNSKTLLPDAASST